MVSDWLEERWRGREPPSSAPLGDGGRRHCGGEELEEEETSAQEAPLGR